MRRIVVLGGRGFFGRAAVDLLSGFGLAPLVGGPSPGADVVVDAEDGGSIRGALRSFGAPASFDPSVHPASSSPPRGTRPSMRLRRRSSTPSAGR